MKEQKTNHILSLNFKCEAENVKPTKRNHSKWDKVPTIPKFLFWYKKKQFLAV